ncbi:MAG: sigma-70 family RNA polymerase sigma factor [Verrucomicrobiota bacterium]
MADSRKDLERIYDEHANHLFHFLLSLRCTESECRDLIQQLFLKLARRPHLIQRARNERPFLMKMIYRLHLDELRQKMRHSGPSKPHAEPMTDLFEAGTDVDAETMRRHLEQALQALPENQRVVVVLKLWHGSTFSDIAQVVGESMGTVTSRYRYGVNKLKDELRPFYQELS